MKRSLATLATALALASIATPAFALRAFLVDCQLQTSVTGRTVWVGTYDVNGQLFERVFSGVAYCPQQLEVY